MDTNSNSNSNLNTECETRLYSSTIQDMERVQCKSCKNMPQAKTSSSSSSLLSLSCTKMRMSCCKIPTASSRQSNCAHTYASCPFQLRCLNFSFSLSLSTECHLSLRRFCTFLLVCSFVCSAYGCGPGRGIGGARRNRKLTPLVFKQHVPNMSEKTLGASGLSEGAIHRQSPKFKDLVPNYNDYIIFKDEEGTGADRLMTRRCKEKLNTLAVSVMNQWPGVRLRVTESWDEDTFHGAESLHYEGRAVDITTSDRDRSKYGMLARLAVEAGFDWVYYESRAHIHCSVKSDASHIPHMNGCFTPDSTVLTVSGERKLMKDVVIGERVLSMTESGEAVFSEVILFMDRNLEQAQEFVQLETASGRILTVTASHLVMVWNKATGVADYMFADKVEEDDFLFVHDDSGQLRPDRVVSLKAVLRKGVIAPLTMEGTIVVDSIAASCYAIVKSQTLAHWSLAPMRLMATLKSWMPTCTSGETCSAETKLHPKIALNTSQQKTQKTSPPATSAQQQNGIHWYAKALYKIKDYVLPQDWRYQ